MKITADALLFDNDGTLVSSMESVVRCWPRWAAECGVTEECARVELHGRPAADIIGDLLPADRVAEARRRIDELEVEDVPGRERLQPGTLARVASLAGARWAVVTCAAAALAEPRLPGAVIRPGLLIPADDIPRGKPDP